jgi:hypothetical protein
MIRGIMEHCRIRKILVINRLYLKSKLNNVGIVGQKLRSNSTPSQLVSLCIRHFVIAAFFGNTLEELMEVDLSRSDFGTEFQYGARKWIN